MIFTYRSRVRHHMLEAVRFGSRGCEPLTHTDWNVPPCSMSVLWPLIDLLWWSLFLSAVLFLSSLSGVTGNVTVGVYSQPWLVVALMNSDSFRENRRWWERTSRVSSFLSSSSFFAAGILLLCFLQHVFSILFQPPTL